MPEDCYFVASFSDTEHAVIDGRTGIEEACLTDRQKADRLAATLNADILN